MQTITQTSMSPIKRATAGRHIVCQAEREDLCNIALQKVEMGENRQDPKKRPTIPPSVFERDRKGGVQSSKLEPLPGEFPGRGSRPWAIPDASVVRRNCGV